MISIDFLYTRAARRWKRITSERIFNVHEKSHRVLPGFENVAHIVNFQVGVITACESGRNMTGA
jgi:hypothetical protein